MTRNESVGGAKWRGLDDMLRHVPVDEAAKQDLLAGMSGDDRFYHGIDHLALLWQRHRRYARHAGLEGSIVDRLVASAIAYHDCVYDTRRDDNEELSAACWLAASHASNLSQSDRLWVADTIRATRDHLAYEPSEAFEPTTAAPAANEEVIRENARLWMLDLDLTPLGESSAAFDRNTRMLRKEVPHLSDDEWMEAQLGFLRRHYEAPQIYRSRALAARFEAPARRNLARSCRADGDQAVAHGATR